MESGASYTFSAYVKTSGTKAAIALYEGTTELARQPVSDAGDWTRFEVSYTNTTSSAKSLKPALLCGSGETVYMDCVQVEKSPTASRYNLIQNGDFTVTGTPAESWTGTNLPTSSGLVTTEDGAAPQLDNTVFKLSGASKTERKLTQEVPVSGKKGDTYILSGWGKGNSVPLSGFDTRDRQFGLRLTFHYTDDTTKQVVAQFNPYTNSTANWQYTAAAAVAEADYSSITVEVLYVFNCNTAYFDGIQLYKEEFSNSYTYDEDNNVVSVVDLQQQKTQYEYENNNLTKQILPNGSEMTYTYDSYHNVKTATTDTGIVYSFDYDAYGNNTKVSITKDGVTISSSAAYSDDGNRLVSATDATGKTTTYQYNANTNVLEWVKYPEDTDATKTTYTYDNMYRMATAAAATDTGLSLSASYTYADDLLTKIQTPSTTYDFTYGDFALRKNVKIGSRTLASYTYTAQDNYLSSLDYGNGDKVQYTYDDQGRVTKQTYEDGATVTYRYNNDGALATLTDSATGRTTTYYYDFIDRMMKYVETGDGYSHTVGYEYDTINNLTKLVETINGTEYETSYTYDADNRVTKVDTGNANKNYTYDGFGRVSQQTTKHGTTNVKTDAFTFKAPSGTSTSSQVTGHTITAGSYSKNYSYTYDDNGNILNISDGTNTISYVYDTANQLIRENNQAGNFTHTWTYDNAGNILERKEYAYTTRELGTPTDTVAYAYGDASWGDLLTSYDGKTITRDEIGNPLNDGTWTYTWRHGRQLASMSDGTTTWNFTYNSDGLRTKRTNGTTTYNYVYNGDKLSQMTVGSNLLQFSYDAAGTPMAVLYNGTTYYYATNLQGDVIAILDATGAAVVEYTYDAWGNLLTTAGSMKDTLGTTNPLRYRSYTYDAEYEFYYLQSRYYDSTLGRFINSDVFASTGQGFLGTNTFIYCNNNPTGLADHSGSAPVAIGIGVAIAVGVAGAIAAHHVAKGGAKLIAKAISSITVRSPKEVVLRFAARTVKQAADVYEYSRSVAKEITDTIKKTPHVHHIVPVGKFSNRSASTINKINDMHEKLKSVGINRFFDPMNLMVVSAQTHARLHTDAYIDHVHSYIMSAGDDKQEVYQMMHYLRIEIAAQDIFASGF